MTILEEKKFHIIKSYIDNKLSKQRAYLSKQDLYRGIADVGLKAKVLADLIIREVDEHNSTLEAKRTRLQNLKYKSHKTYQSKLIVGHNVPFRTIDQLIKDNPKMDWYDVYKLLRD